MTGTRPRCRYCGTAHDAAVRFCPYCGASTDPEVEVPAAEQSWLDRPFLDWFRGKPKDTDRESGAHKLLNGLVGLWTLGYALVIVLPIMASNGQGAIGAVVGFGAAAVLFVPWIIGLVILVVLRSTTRAR